MSFEQVRADYEKTKNILEMATKAHALAFKALVAVCPHEEIETVEHHSPGTYYDRAYWYRVDTCKLCRKKLSNVLTGTGGYG